MKKVYLGDSVYLDVENGMVKLTTENGGEPSNTIFLEPAVVDALLNFVSAMRIRPKECPACEADGWFWNATPEKPCPYCKSTGAKR